MMQDQLIWLENCDEQLFVFLWIRPVSPASSDSFKVSFILAEDFVRSRSKGGVHGEHTPSPPSRVTCGFLIQGHKPSSSLLAFKFVFS